MPSPQKGFKGDLTEIGKDYKYERCPECGEIVELYTGYYICKNVANCRESTMVNHRGKFQMKKHAGRAGLSPSPAQIKAQCRQIRELKVQHGIMHKHNAIQSLTQRMAG